jgi:regulator of protease activity HflC (stomatin/prohibitin superfamily)
MEGNMAERIGMQQFGAGCLGAGAVVLVIAALTFSPFSMVPAGIVGVLTLFGRVTGRTISEGFNIVNPLARTHLMSVRTQEVKETTRVPSSEGLILQMTPRCFTTSIRLMLESFTRRSARTTSP